MSTDERSLLQSEYDLAAQEYLRSLPLEHFMEATTQSTQRKITVESFDLIQLRRPDIQLFSELLVQYRLPRRTKIRQVVPDNMVVVHHEPIQAKTNYALALQPVGPFLTMEYVSKRNQRKDYEESFQKYERELKVPYYLMFHPDEQELSLYHLSRGKYVSVKPNAAELYAIPKLELELALHKRWMRFWFRGELLPLPADLQRQVDDFKQQLNQMQAELEEVRRQKEQLLARLRDLGIDPGKS